MTHHMRLLFFLAVSLPTLPWTKSESTKDEMRRLIEEYITDHNIDKGCSSLREDVSFLTNENLMLKQALTKLESELRDMKYRIEDIMTENREMNEHMVAIDKEMSQFRDTDRATEQINHGYRNNSDRSYLGRNQQHGRGSNTSKRLLIPNTGTSARPPIAFTASISANLVILTNSQIFIYDHIVTNSGNAYNQNNGMFTSPKRGIYAFYASLLTVPGKSIEAKIVHNGNPFCYFYGGDKDLFGPGFNMAVIELNVGDAVWVKIHGGNYDAGVWLDKYYTSFSGFLLYET